MDGVVRRRKLRILKKVRTTQNLLRAHPEGESI
jgi:hypothetical protein